jgi:putative ABC transport system permease protein
MNFLEIVSFVFENVKRQKGRVFLTSLGVTIGSASIILLIALVGGLQKLATDQFTSIVDLSTIEVFSSMGGGVSGFRGMIGGTVRTGSEAEVVPITEDVIDDIALIDNVSNVIPKQSVSGSSTLLYQKYEGQVSLTGVAVEDLSELGLSLAGGDLRLKSGSIFLGAFVTEDMFRPNYSGSDAILTTDLTSRQVKIKVTKNMAGGGSAKTFRYRVAGILDESGGRSDYAVYIHMNDADTIVSWINGEQIDHNSDGYSSLTVIVEEQGYISAVSNEITGMGFQAMTFQTILESVNSLFVIMQFIFGGVGAITLVVAAIGIANTMTMAILERTKEIGLLKALGATNQDILSIFIGEAAFIGLIGGIGGTIIGLLLGAVINIIAGPFLQGQAVAGADTVNAVFIPLYLPLLALIFSAIIGSLSGLYPALRAQSMQPVVALKYE